MHRLEPLPEHIIVAFENHGIEPSDVVLCAATDLDRNGNFAEEWLVATREKLCFLSGETISPPQRMARRSNHRKQQWRETGYREIALADMEELKADTLNGNGVLMATVKGQPEILCRYSNTMSRKFGQVTRLVSKLMEDKELTTRISRKRCTGPPVRHAACCIRTRQDRSVPNA